MTAIALAEKSLTTRAVVANARTWGDKVEGRFIVPGLISYTDIGQGVAYVSKETLDRCARTFEAKPFSLRHDAENVFTGEKMGDPSPENQELVSVGYISEVYFNPADGWFWFRGTVHNDEAKRRIREGWGVSCTYVPTEAHGPGGTLNGVAYDYETRGFFGESIALEPKDKIRYEGAKISIVRNAKPNSGASKMSLFKFWKKKPLTDAELADAAALETQAKEAADRAAKIRNAAPDEGELSAETLVSVDEKGTQAKFGDVVSAYQEYLRTRNSMTQIDPETEVEYAPGRKEKMGVMCAHYKNAMDEEEKKKEDAKRHAEEEQKKKDEEEKKRSEAARNSKPAGITLTHFDRVMHASSKTLSEAPTKRVSTSSVEAQKERGKRTWGLGKN